MSDILDGFVPYVKGTGGKTHKQELTGKPGCYMATVEVNGMWYVGSTSNLAHRASSNLSALKHNKHCNKNLQEAYNNNPGLNIMVRPTDTVEQAIRLEQKIVDKLLPLNKLHNNGVKDVTRATLGMTYSDESRKKMSDAQRGHKASEETRLKMSEARLGRPHKPHSIETKEKMSVMAKERLATDEGKTRITHMAEKRKEPVICDGVTFSSLTEAAKALGVSDTTVIRRCKSDKHPNYFKIEKNT